MMHKTLVLFVAFVCLIIEVSAERQTSFPIYIHVTNYVNVRRQPCPVQGVFPCLKVFC